MNCLIGTFVSIRTWSSVSAMTEGLPDGAPHQGFLLVNSIPGLTLMVASCSPAQPPRSSYPLKYTHTRAHTSHSDD